MKEQEKKKAAVDDERTVEDEEEERRKQQEAEAAKAPKPKKGSKKKIDQPAPEAVEEKPYDPIAEKLRRQKLVEEADERLAGDLFSGLDKPKEDASKEAKEKEAAAKAQAEREEAEAKAAAAKPKKAETVVVDAFDAVELNTQADVTQLVKTCLDKVEQSKAKGAAQKLFIDLFKALEPKLTSQEVYDMDKAIAGLVKEKKVQKASVDANKRKTNEKMSKNTKFDTGREMQEVYGGGGEDWDEDWDEEEWWDEEAAATAGDSSGKKK